MYFPINLLISLAYLIPSHFLLYGELDEKNTWRSDVFDSIFYFGGSNKHGMWNRQQ